MKKDKVNLALSALFHNIGKFKQIAKDNSEGSYDWLKSDSGESLIAFDKETDKIISEAQKYIVEAQPPSTYLQNVFSMVLNPEKSEPDEQRDAPPESFYEPKRADEWIEPVKTATGDWSHKYQKLWGGFKNEFKQLKNRRNIEVINHLLEKYTSYIPLVSPDFQTISLYDHSKITTAIALCLCEKDTSKDSSDTDIFTLIGGDISGVQKFIYTISSKGALKSLKGRSFFLELMTEHTVDRILEETELCRCNVIFNGGGHFYILAPNTQKTSEAINKVREEMNSYLFEAFNGSLQQFIESVDFGKDGFINSSSIWGELSEKLEKAKRRKWKTRINSLLVKPEMPHHSCLTENCDVCWREDVQIKPFPGGGDELNLCTSCREQYRMGKNLQNILKDGKKPMIYRFDKQYDEYKEMGIQIGKSIYTIPLHDDKKEKNWADNASAVFHINDWDLSHFVYPKSRPLFAGMYLPSDENRYDIEGMAANGFGMSNIAVLRMDVDRLGRIFQTSIPEEQRSFIRMASLSRQFSLFFKYHLNQIMKYADGYPKALKLAPEKQERLLNIIYSGGDDLFLLGHWSDITQAAFDIRKAFRKFTANPYISLSGGFVLGSEHEPVYRLAELAGDAEDLAKDNGRNSVTLFDKHTFKWNEAETVFKLAQTISKLGKATEQYLFLPPESVSKSTLHKFLAVIREHKKEKNVWIFPKLAYIFGRSEPSGQEYLCAWKEIENYVFSRDRNWHFLEVAILWNLMMMRGKDE